MYSQPHIKYINFQIIFIFHLLHYHHLVYIIYTNFINSNDFINLNFIFLKNHHQFNQVYQKFNFFSKTLKIPHQFLNLKDFVAKIFLFIFIFSNFL
jgi:hypothetical protein